MKRAHGNKGMPHDTRDSLARRIRTASAMLRSPQRCATPGGARQDSVQRPLHAAATRSPRQPAEAAAGQVDLRALRVQLENSLQRLQAGEFSPKVPGSAAHGNAASCAPTLRQDWADKCTAHWATRRRRAIARAALIRWRQQQQDIQVIAELEAELEQAQMELATFRDPARTQVKWHRSRDCFPGHRASIATAASLCLP